MKNQIKNFFQTGKWKMKKDKLNEDKQLTKNIFNNEIKKYGKELVKNRQLIKGYLSQNQKYFYIQNELTSFMFDLNTTEFIRLVKFYKLFESDFFEDLISPINQNDQIKELLKEIEIIESNNKKNEKLKKEIEAELYDYDFFQLLFNLAVWNDYKYLQQIKDNPLNTAIAPYNSQSISLVLRLMQNSNSFKIKNQIKDINPEKIQERFLVFLKHYAENRQKWLPFEALMEKAIDIIHWEDILEGYIYQNARLIILDENKYYIIPSSPEDEVRWKKNGKMQVHLERFYHNESKNYVPLQQRINPFVIPLTFSRNIDFYYNGVPKDINFNDKKIEPYHILLFFEGLNAFHLDRYYNKIIEFSKENPKDNIFQTIIKAIESENLWYKPMMGALNITDIDYFIDRIVGKIQFDIPINKEQVKNIFEFFTFDLNNSNDNLFNILEQPFLKLNDKYIYFTSLVVANNLAYIIENRILKQDNKTKKEYEETISKNFEKLISDIFIKNGFYNTKVGVNIPETKNNKKTDIDILVWQDNQLLIVQAKKTYRRLKASEIENYNPQLEKGAEQIETSIEYIKNNTKRFLSQNNIDPEKLEIFGLIISNTTEGSFKEYGIGKYKKITAAELAILLGDKKNLIIDWDLEAFSLFLNSREKAIDRFDRTNPNIIRAAKIIKEEELKLKFNQTKYWNDKEKSITNLITAINEKYLWNDLLNIEIDMPNKDATPDELEAYYLFFEGKHLFELKQYNKAKTIFEKAYKLNPKDRQTKMYYADCLAETGKKEEAISIYSEVIKDYPNYWLAYSNRATTYQEIQEWKKAYDDFCKVIEIDPTNEQAYLMLLNLNSEFELPNFTNIEEILRNIVTNQNERIQKNSILSAFNNILQGEKESEKFNKILAEISVYMIIGEQINDFTQALKITEEALKNYPNNSKLISTKAWIYKIQKKLDEAISICKDTLKTDNKESELWRVLGELYMEKNDIENALKNLKKAIELDKNNSFAHYSLALIYKKNNKTNDAIKELKIALKTENINWKILFYKELHALYKNKNDFDNAIVCLKKAIELGAYYLVPDWDLLNLTKLQNDYKFNDICY